MILCDTNIMIEAFKGNTLITSNLVKIGMNQLAVSAITVAELYYGAFNKQELSQIKKHLLPLQQLPLNAQITTIFIDLMEKYSLSHNLTLPDALIAATAIHHDLPLYTLNIKDFRYMPFLNLHEVA